MNVHPFSWLGKTSATPRLVIEDREQRKRIISSIHDECHLGINRTNELVAKKYYWPGLYKDVNVYVSGYSMCVWNACAQQKSFVYHTITTLHLCSCHPQVETCEQCQRNNKKLNKAAGSLHPIPVRSKLWSQMGIDLIGPLPETPRGNKYIVTLTDYFSKWAEAAPLPNKTADGVARFMHSVSFLFTPACM